MITGISSLPADGVFGARGRVVAVFKSCALVTTKDIITYCVQHLLTGYDSPPGARWGCNVAWLESINVWVGAVCEM